MNASIPLKQYVYGDIEAGTALTIDVFEEGPHRYQARVWVDGDTAAMDYCDTFQGCVAYFGTMDTEQDHDRDPPPKADAIAPQLDGESGYRWLLVTDGKWERKNGWWEQEEANDHPDLILFSEMTEDHLGD